MTLKETGGAPVTIHSQIDAFDGFVVNNLTGLKISVPANGEHHAEPAVVQLDELEAHGAAHLQRHRLRTATSDQPRRCQLVNLMATPESRN